MESNCSSVAFRSNLYPVEGSCLGDRVFQSEVHDPFSLEILYKNCSLTPIQRQEYKQASLHCAYAAPNDYPWGTIKDGDGCERVVCRCLNTACRLFSGCRPDFDPAELKIHEENRTASPAIFKLDENAHKKESPDAGNAGAAAKLFYGAKPKEDTTDTSVPPKTPPTPDPYVLPIPPKPVPQPVKFQKIDFNSFAETTQDVVIEAEPVERSMVNAGPGTGKTWTLIEKIIHMINEEKAVAENILVLCFSRSAVEVVRSRLADAADAGRIGFEWQDVDVRTFDSFSTYMLAWVQENHPELLPRQFVLEAYDYDQRIRLATSVFKKKKDMLADYEHIIVDEVQDLVGSRAELVLAMLKGLPDCCGFTISGDSCQALYDYMAEDDPSVMSSEQFYQEVFTSFSNANYYAMTENHRQGDEFGELTVPYRKAILTGTSQERTAVAGTLLANIPHMATKLSQFSEGDALRYIHQGTLGILTRTNGQALQISAWLRTAEIGHSLQRGLGSPTLGDWISKVFCEYENESIDETAFVTKHLELFPEAGYEKAMNRWMALVSTQRGEAKKRYEVADLLKGLLRNAKEPMLYESSSDAAYAITVSNIHRAKGKEFDSVIVIDDVIETMADPDTEDMLEHKVCYVALTRPKKRIERAEISKRDKLIYITRNSDQSKRCSKASIGRKRYISHFEVGSDTDLDIRSFAASKKLQGRLQHSIQPGTRLKLIKCPENTNSYVTYRIVVEDNENITLGYASKLFARELEKAIQHILKINCSVLYSVYPHAFCDVYVNNIITCISGMAPVPPAAKTFGDVSIWTGMAITGFAAVDKDTY